MEGRRNHIATDGENIVTGVISDTHGLIRPEALAALQGSSLIVHAGDIGNEAVLHALEQVAPVYAVRGNNDKSEWAEKIPTTNVLTIGKALVYMIHDIKELDFDPAAAGYHAVISGHSHRPSILRRNGVLFINPGSAGPRRFQLPVAVARLHAHGHELDAQLIELEIPRKKTVNRYS